MPEQLYPSHKKLNSLAFSDMMNYTLTREETRTFAECRHESFYYRCLPLSTLAAGLAYYGVKQGIFPNRPPFGAVPMMSVGIIFGFVMGKAVYAKTCTEKLMKLENSPMAAVLRAKHQNIHVSDESFKYESYQPSIEPELESSPLIEEFHPDLSTHAEGADSYDAVTETLSPYSSPEGELTSNRSYVSYDELRRANREKSSRRPQQYPSEPTTATSSSSTDAYIQDSSQSRPESPPTKAGPYFNPKKNKYGDVWD